MKAKCSIHPIFSICVARSFLPALRIKPSLLKVAIEQFGIRSTNCRTQAQQGDHLSMGFPAFRVPEPPLGRRAVAHPPPCTSWAVLVSGKHPSVTIHKTHGSHTPSIPRHWSAAGLMRSSFVLEKKPGKFRGEVLHIPVASHKRENEKYCNINLYVMLWGKQHSLWLEIEMEFVFNCTLEQLIGLVYARTKH